MVFYAIASYPNDWNEKKDFTDQIFHLELVLMSLPLSLLPRAGGICRVLAAIEISLGCVVQMD